MARKGSLSAVVSGARRWAVGIGGALVIALGAVGLQAPLAAQAAVPDRFGFAFMNNPTPPGGMVLDTAHQWGSWKTAFPAAWATVDQIAVGRYIVHFPQIGPAFGPPLGIVHVTAVNPGPVWCQAALWQAVPPNEDVYVQCYRAGGAPVNSTFTVLFTESTGAPVPAGGDYGYVFARPNGAIVTQYNSTGAANLVSAGPVGLWKVGLPGLGLATPAGNIQVTAVDPQQPVRCKVVAWSPGAGGQTIEVGCFSAAGAPIATSWTLTYQRERSVFGALAPPKSFGYTFPTTAAAPPSPINFNSQGGANTITPAGLGLTFVQFPLIGLLQNHVQVTAFGNDPNFCQLNTLWGTGGGTAAVRDVACYDNTGAAATTRSFLSYTSRQ